MTITKEDVNAELRHILYEDAIPQWWDTDIPSFGGATPNQMWETNPERVLRLVQSYVDPSFG